MVTIHPIIQEALPNKWVKERILCLIEIEIIKFIKSANTRIAIQHVIAFSANTIFSILLVISKYTYVTVPVIAQITYFFAPSSLGKSLSQQAEMK